MSVEVQRRLGPCRIKITLSWLHFPPSLVSVPMAIQKEPGQKGVSWSNIAVGTSISSHLLAFNPHSNEGAIMNMVRLLKNITFQDRRSLRRFGDG